ncbi:MAG: Hpt domain-containing protein [Candidatus Delongbacteria bacterium]|nr:Hpt domain-containing protein [Candidatus Delongbacteria bacterium]MBN2834252.1 Hpt domain-containing protein [Candidatus Delongbacteria bacterium]
MKLLIVDDDKLIRDLLREYFLNQGYEIQTAENGSEALSYIRDFDPDIVITDIKMPGISGIDLALKVFEKKKIPIILISGYSTQNELDKLSDLEYYFYPKPVKSGEIAKKIEELSSRIEGKEKKVIQSTEYVEIDDDLLYEFITEGFELLDSVEPKLIKLSEVGYENSECWRKQSCTNRACKLNNKVDFIVPCWKVLEFNPDCSNKVSLNSDDCKNCDYYKLRKIDDEEINAIFRMFHSFKGSSSFLGLTIITNITHEAETLLDLIRKEKILVTSEYSDILMKATDVLREEIEYLESKSNKHSENSQIIIEELTRINRSVDDVLNNLIAGKICNDSHEISNPDIQIDEMKKSYSAEIDLNFEPEELSIKIEDEEEIRFEISDEMKDKFISESLEIIDIIEDSLLKIENDPDNGVFLSSAFRNIHSFKGNAGFFGFKDLENLAHKMETVLENMLDADLSADKAKIPVLIDMLDLLKGGIVNLSSGGRGDIPGLEDMMKSLEDELNIKLSFPINKPKEVQAVKVEKIEQKSITENDEEPTRIVKDDGLVSKVKNNETSKNDDLSLQEDQKNDISLLKNDENTIELEKQKNENIEKNLTAPKKEIIVEKKDEFKRSDIRVDLDKLDTLLNLVGELVIAGAMVTTNSDVYDKGFEKFEKASANLNRIIKDLQEIAMEVRMVPLAGLFSKMVRLVHDLSRKSNKKVKLTTVGEQTEVDKTVIEKISDPLVHIIRNAVDHGLETSVERVNIGKDSVGHVTLEARHESGEVQILVKDDGRGLDKERIYKKAVEKGIISSGQDLKDKEIFNLIFEPGFSTADEVTEISGRGVGMDVVRRNLEKLKGSIDITTEKDRGTIFTLRIPLTLAIIDGMLVKVGVTEYVIPILSIRESLIANEKNITISPDGSEYIRVRQELLPIIRLKRIHGIEGVEKEIHEGTIVVIEHKGKTVALLVDTIISQESIVVKGLSDYIGSIKGISGCTILGNGDICLILDIGSLLELAEQN